MLAVSRAALALCISTMLGAGCGKPSEPERPASGAPVSSPSPPAVQPVAQWGNARITGTVAFSGKPPPRVPLKIAADPFCETHHAGAPVLSEEVVVNENGTLRNVLVHITSGLEGKRFPVSQTPVILDQEGCRYVPHVSAIQTGQPLVIRNSDDTLHNVHCIAKANPGFNLGQPTKGHVSRKVFQKPELAVRFKCDVHPWMGAYLAVLDHPFSAVTGDDGRFIIEQLPAGTYTVQAWHEKFGTQEQTVTVADNQTITIPFEFKPAL